MTDPRAELQTHVYGFMVTQAIGAVARAGVADLVSAGPRAVADVAAESGYDADALRRVLRALAALGIFRLDGDAVANTPSSEFLRSEVDGSVRWIAQSFSGEHYRVWEHADEAFRRREAVSERALGGPYFDWLSDHPTEASIFNRAMGATSTLRAAALVERPWGSELVVDVGGGTGTLLTALLSRHPGLRGIVLDLPHAADEARARFAAAGIADRCEFVEGDFFASVPAADAYVLSQILHDWDDEPATRILQACRAAASAGTRLLVLDAVVPEGDGAHLAKLLDLHMLVLIGGRERTEHEWRALLEAGGWRLSQVDEAGGFPVLEAAPLASASGSERGEDDGM